MRRPGTGCAICIHKELFGCKAYDEIPYDIAEGIEEHTSVRPDQMGDYVFTPDQELIEMLKREKIIED